MMKAVYNAQQAEGGYARNIDETVTILGFVNSTYQPGYSMNDFHGTLAIIAFHNGSIRQCELRHLKYLGDAQ